MLNNSDHYLFVSTRNHFRYTICILSRIIPLL